jgi:hypothetical protein
MFDSLFNSIIISETVPRLETINHLHIYLMKYTELAGDQVSISTAIKQG